MVDVNLAQQLELLKARGFDDEKSQTVILIREAAIELFNAFPNSFVLYGGANLILFQNSVRSSRDLDLLTFAGEVPDAEAVAKVLSEGLKPLSELLGFAPLTVNIDLARSGLTRIEILGSDQRTLFTVDLGGVAQVIQSGVQQDVIEAVSTATTATIKFVSRDLILLQKAEAFVFRRAVTARDAYDIRLLLDAGAELSGQLTDHLDDALSMHEVGTDEITERIDMLTTKLCRSQLADVLPPEVYTLLEKADFEPLRASVRQLFRKWT